MKKKFAAIAIALTMTLTQAAPAFATTISELEMERNMTSAKLQEIKNSISLLEQQKRELLSAIDVLDKDLVTTIAAIDELDKQIKDKEVEINGTTINLANAEKRKTDSYEAMKKRIQYIYEKGGNVGWASILFSGEDVSSLINRAEFTQQMYDYDRKCLEEYAETVTKVKELKEEQEIQKAECEAMKVEQEEEKKTLEAYKAETVEAEGNCEEQLAQAEEAAIAYEDIVEEQTAQIQAMYEEEARIAAEEAAAAAAAEEAKAEAESEETQAYEDDSYTEDSYNEEPSYDNESNEYEDSSETEESYENNYDNNQDGNESYSNEYDEPEVESVSSTSSSSSSASSSASSSSKSSSNTTSTKKSSSGITGQDVVDYAMQYVGNPYVWGGNSLTNGVDCSGFVNQVYKNLGYNVARQSAELRNSGYEVSYEDAQPGDIICYSGHVGIYMGNGQIVHAADEKSGIKAGTDATYHTILAVRRVVD